MAFIKEYWRNYRVLAISLSVICAVAFYLSVIPAGAVTASGSFPYEQRLYGGVQPAQAETNVVWDMSVPRNAAGEKLQLVGTFKVTHYCACTICTYGTGITATGKQVAEGMVAADWKVLPPHTKIYIKRGDTLVEKVVEDRGGGVQGKQIDVYVPSHQQALRMGVYSAEIYVDPGTVLP